MSNVVVFSKSYEDDICSHGYRYFDSEAVRAKIFRCTIAINQPMTVGMEEIWFCLLKMRLNEIPKPQILESNAT
jgi:hypothetical protein